MGSYFNRTLDADDENVGIIFDLTKNLIMSLITDICGFHVSLKYTSEL